MTRVVPLGAWRRASLPIATIALSAAAGACAGGDGTGTGNAAPAAPVGEGDAAQGEQVAEDNGCQACHRVEGGGIGPAWSGLYGSERPLEDGTTVVADAEYLVRAITDPDVQKVDGYAIAMPEYSNLSDDDVADLVAYLRSLSTTPVPTTEGGAGP